MGIVKKSLVSLAAAGLVIAPVAAQAAPVASSDVRASADAGQQAKLGGSYILLVAALAAIIAAIVIAVDSGNNSPTSP